MNYGGDLKSLVIRGRSMVNFICLEVLFFVWVVWRMSQRDFNVNIQLDCSGVAPVNLS